MTFLECIFVQEWTKDPHFQACLRAGTKMNKNEALPVAGKDEIVVYQPEGGEFHIEVRVENETVWLTQAQIADLFGTKRPAITKHLKNIYASQELDEKTTCSVLEHMGKDADQVYETKYYNLDAILSVGYRVNSKNATYFRRWANQVLKEYMLKGYCINQRMLGNGVNPTNLPQQQQMIENVDSRLTSVEQRVDFFVNTVHNVQNQRIEQLSSDIQKIKKNFIDPSTYKHFLILDGQKLDADVAFSKIYGMAKKSIIIIDNYVGVKTLDLLRDIAKNVGVQIFSEQWGDKRITPAIMADFKMARPDVPLLVDRPNRKFHDRYVFLDYGSRNEKLFLCGASSKDAGNKITTIMQIECPEMYHPIVDELRKSQKIREGK